jgi:transcriptional regulator with XRE-family HTH domain
MNDRQIFGAFLKEKRKEREITVRAMAEKLDVQVGYYCDIESGRRSPIDFDFLGKIVSALILPDEDAQTFYDLAGKAREAAPPDLTGYINSTQMARVALRVAKEVATDEDWERFIGELNKKKKG